jgi:hypothetical protein
LEDGNVVQFVQNVPVNLSLPSHLFHQFFLLVFFFIQAVLPDILNMNIKDRKIAKNIMQDAKNRKDKFTAGTYDKRQERIKVGTNSIYG